MGVSHAIGYPSRMSEPSSAAPRRFRLDEWMVDLTSGEIRREGETPRRLAPQPNRLLELLVERAGEVVSHREIRRRVWGDVEVDFERGLHFCVRQVREALDDQAAAPRFIENLPRRGYRLKVEPEPLVEEPPVSDSPPPPGRGGRGARVSALLAVALILGLAGAWLWRTAAPATPRLALLPFTPPTGIAPIADPERVVQRLLLDLGRNPGRLELIGPTTTAAYGSDPASLRRLIADLRPDYLINVRYLQDETESPMLVELIRAADGAHVWVERYGPAAGAERIAAEVTAAVRARLG